MITTRRGLLVAPALAVMLLLPGAAPATAVSRPAGAPAVTATTDILIPAYPAVRRGDISLSRVRTVQYLLRARQNPQLMVVPDGVFGPLTQRAVRAFQAAAHLPVTGVVDPTTWRRLVLPARVGSRGDGVRAVQALLNIYGRTHVGYRLQVDGVFGPATRSAVRAFQTAVDITNEGVVDNTTWAFMLFEADRKVPA